MFRKLAPIAFVALAMTTTGAAQAQTALTNGVSLRTGTQSQTTYNSINLGSMSGIGFATQMPMSLTYAGVNVNVSFNATSGVSQTGGGWNPTPGSNYIRASGAAGASFTFSSAQEYFGFAWSSPDAANNVQFYNGDTLLASMNGTQFQSAANIGLLTLSTYAGFSFSELGFDRVVMSSVSSGTFEAGALRFSDDSVDVAPIPLNAASLGGLMSFLMMLGMRGKGGPQVMVRMALASIMPRRHALA